MAMFLSVLSIVPHHYARLTYFRHPELRKINAVQITIKADDPYPGAAAARSKRSPRVSPKMSPRLFCAV